ncbi:MAG: thioredoxin [Lachnospiraceae bacterium]|nr:thioredoxin [Lachnospiraceae bacterium]
MEYKITYENYEQEVAKSDKPVLLDLWAEWCGPCKMVAPVISQIAEEYDGVLKVGKVNVDEEEELAMKFGAMSIPMMVLVKNGEVAAATVGFQPKASLEAALGLNELKK